MDTKKCEVCGGDIPHHKFESKKAYMKKKTCSREHANQLNKKLGKGFWVNHYGYLR